MSRTGLGQAGSGTLATTGLVGLLMQTLLAERTAFANGDGHGDLAPLNELANRMTREAMTHMMPATDVPAVAAEQSPAIAN